MLVKWKDSIRTFSVPAGVANKSWDAARLYVKNIYREYWCMLCVRVYVCVWVGECVTKSGRA